jgi:hypothetical protein
MGTFKKDILWHITNKSGRGVYSLLKYPFVLTALVPCLLDFDLWQCLSLEETLFFGFKNKKGSRKDVWWRYGHKGIQTIMEQSILWMEMLLGALLTFRPLRKQEQMTKTSKMRRKTRNV